MLTTHLCVDYRGLFIQKPPLLLEIWEFKWLFWELPFLNVILFLWLQERPYQVFYQRASTEFFWASLKFNSKSQKIFKHFRAMTLLNTKGWSVVREMKTQRRVPPKEKTRLECREHWISHVPCPIYPWNPAASLPSVWLFLESESR